MGGNRGSFDGGQPEVFGTPESFEQALGENTSEMKPLAADGSTERKMGSLALKLSGEELDEASEKEMKQKITELKDNPYELQNYRDEAMTEFLRGSFGRIFGDDSTANGDEN